jgi:NAD(P)-dependent dehydrogenase (short-subunit alcohol dehydrogenase family)
MELSLAGRTALITGGSKGLGLATAEAYAAAGAAVALVARDAATLAGAERAILDKVPAAKVVTVPADITTAEGCKTGFGAATAALGPIDILVNNAGQAAGGPFLSSTDEAWQADFDLKVFAHVRLSRLAIPSMQQRRWGRIINVLASGAKAPAAGSLPTTASRSAGMAITKALATEFAPQGILVNALLVGIIESDQWVRHFPDVADREKWMAQQSKAIPVGRVGRAEEFASAALFLASDASSYISGVAINVDGGTSPVL